MVFFLDLPREIRDKILEHALYTGRDPPLSPSELRPEGRCTVPARVSGSWSIDATSRVRFEKRPRSSPLVPLLLVNRQVHAELKEVASRVLRQRPNYTLDLMYLNDCSIWPTWTSVPMFSGHVGTVHATFRIFHCPPEIETTDRRRNAMFTGGDGSPPPIVWLFYHTLVVFLERGLRVLKDDSSGNHGPGITIRRLIIDVSPAIEQNILPLVCRSSASSEDREQVRVSRWQNFFEEFYSDRGINIAEMGGGLLAATQLANFIQSQIGGLLSLGNHRFSYGSVLYEHIGEIEIRLNEQTRSKMNLTSLLSKAPLVSDFGGEFSREKHRKRYAEWIVSASKRRREDGLPLGAPSLHQQQFLDEYGLLVDYMSLFS